MVRVYTQQLPPFIQSAAVALTIQDTVLVAPIIIYPLELIADLVLRGRELNQLLMIGDGRVSFIRSITHPCLPH